jgi:2-keto-3-deoxy-L-rhamnonate aldolase RhmA
MPTAIGENSAKKQLAANELVLCMGVNQLRTPNIAMIAAACGFDAVYIDLEHNPTSLETAAAVCVAALGMGITPIARVASHDPHDATRILDCGAQGVMVPHVQNAAEAKAIVEACLYAPKGHRSAFGSGPALGYAAIGQAEVCRRLNQETLLMAMIETPEAVGNAEAIAAVDGIDVLHIGASDLSTEMGIPGQYQHERMRAAFEAVAKAARGHGKAMGVGRGAPGFRVPELALEARCALPDRRLRCRLHPQRRPRRRETAARAEAKLSDCHAADYFIAAQQIAPARLR